MSKQHFDRAAFAGIKGHTQPGHNTIVIMTFRSPIVRSVHSNSTHIHDRSELNQLSKPLAACLSKSTEAKRIKRVLLTVIFFQLHIDKKPRHLILLAFGRYIGI